MRDRGDVPPPRASEKLRVGFEWYLVRPRCGPARVRSMCEGVRRIVAFDGVDIGYWVLRVETVEPGGRTVSVCSRCEGRGKNEAHLLQEDDDPSPDRREEPTSLRPETRVSRTTGTASTSFGAGNVSAGVRKMGRRPPPTTTPVVGRQGRVAPASRASAVVSGCARAARQSPRARRPGPQQEARLAGQGRRRGECRRRRARRR